MSFEFSFPDFFWGNFFSMLNFDFAYLPMPGQPGVLLLEQA
jgi:hypothetical protein